MRTEIRIGAGELDAKAWLNDTETANRVMALLPVTSSVNVWGEEVYFPIPVEAALEDPRETVELGDIAYWPQGKALCIFFGRTPASEGDEIRPISPVNVVGRVDGDRESFQDLLGALKRGEELIISR